MIFALFILATMVMTGCQATETFYQGYKADNESISKLSTPGTQQGSWKTFDLDLNYQYEYKNNVLDISGTVNMSFFHEINSSRIRKLDIYLFFLDEASKVLETALLSRTSIDYLDFGLQFSKNLQVPTGAKSFAFGHRGEAVESGGDDLRGGGGVRFFYDLPKRPR